MELDWKFCGHNVKIVDKSYILDKTYSFKEALSKIKDIYKANRIPPLFGQVKFTLYITINKFWRAS